MRSSCCMLNHNAKTFCILDVKGQQRPEFKNSKQKIYSMPSLCVTVCSPYSPNLKMHLLHFSLQQMGLLKPAAQQTEGQWTGQAQTKVPSQIPGISSALSPLVTMVSFSARAEHSIVDLHVSCDLLLLI